MSWEKALAIREGLKIREHQTKSFKWSPAIAVGRLSSKSDVHSHLKQHTLFDRVACLSRNLPQATIRSRRKFFSSAAATFSLRLVNKVFAKMRLLWLSQHPAPFTACLRNDRLEQLRHVCMQNPCICYQEFA
jgi:hypothetical protein